MRVLVAVGALALSPPVAATETGPSAAGPAGVRWGGELFTTRESLGRWLGARGIAYETWAGRHPEAAATRLTGPVPSGAAGSNGSSRLLRPILLALSIALVLVLWITVVPPRRLAHVPGAGALEARRGEIAVLATGTLLIVGLVWVALGR